MLVLRSLVSIASLDFERSKYANRDLVLGNCSLQMSGVFMSFMKGSGPAALPREETLAPIGVVTVPLFAETSSIEAD